MSFAGWFGFLTRAKRTHPEPETGGHAEPGPATDGADYCAICMSSCRSPKRLERCGHEFCSECIALCFEKNKPACPICGTLYGLVTGNMPPGTMSVTQDTCTDVPGYGRTGLITIVYRFNDGIQTHEHPHPGRPYSGTTRTAYLPNNEEGRKVCKLLRRAFDARLTFTIGRSATTGLDDQVIWNDIHHKTSLTGGPTQFQVVRCQTGNECLFI